MKKNTLLISMQLCAVAIVTLIHAAACSTSHNNKITQVEKGKIEEGEVEKSKAEITKNPKLNEKIEDLQQPDKFKTIKQIIGENEETIEGVKWTADKKKKLFNEIEKIEGVRQKNTLLAWAAARGYLDTVKLLWHKGADLDKVNGDGQTAFMQAACWGHLEIVQFLFDKVADVNQADNDGAAAFMYAASMGSLKVVQFLFDKVADVNQADNNGWTAFTCAASEGKLDTVKFLLNNQVKVDPEALEDIKRALKRAKKGSEKEDSLKKIKKLMEDKLLEKSGGYVLNP